MGLLLQILVLSLTLVVAVPVSFAQMNVAEIAGLVIDPAGDVIVAASVTARITATGLQVSTITSMHWISSM